MSEGECEKNLGRSHFVGGVHVATSDIHEAKKNGRKMGDRKCRATSLADVTWENIELPQTLNPARYDCFPCRVLLFAQANRKIISTPPIPLGVVVSWKTDARREMNRYWPLHRRD